MSASRQEQASLVAFVNSFRTSKRITAFDDLSDGKTLMEVSVNCGFTRYETDRPLLGQVMSSM